MSDGGQYSCPADLTEVTAAISSSLTIFGVYIISIRAGYTAPSGVNLEINCYRRLCAELYAGDAELRRVVCCSSQLVTIYYIGSLLDLQ